jgi:hypothetical protein
MILVIDDPSVHNVWSLYGLYWQVDPFHRIIMIGPRVNSARFSMITNQIMQMNRHNRSSKIPHI